LEDVYHNREKVAESKKVEASYEIVKNLYNLMDSDRINPELGVYHQKIIDAMDAVIEGKPGAAEYSNSLIAEIKQKRAEV
jgi:hypothetical protein